MAAGSRVTVQATRNLDGVASIGTLTRKGRGIPSAAAARLGRRLPVRGLGAAVLCYHDVGRDPANRTDYYLSPERFRDQIEWIREWGLSIVPLAEIVDRLLAGRDLDGLVAVTFDDALAGVAEYAIPTLVELNVPSTVFVVTEELGVNPPFWPGAAQTLTADELVGLTETGLVSLGSHTQHHVSLPDVDPAVRATELGGSRTSLYDLTGTTANLLAYPSGHHDEDCERASAAAGYRAAFTFSFGRVIPTTDPFAIPRFCMTAEHDRFRLARQLARPITSW